MNFTPTTTPKVVKSLFPSLVWNIPTTSKELYLTFDDGPTPKITDWTLDILKAYNAKATFFCIGKNVISNPDTFKRILEEGHTIGNHTNDHVKGWQTSKEEYLNNVALCNTAFTSQNLDKTSLFRPPYGQIKPKQIKAIQELDYKIIMWDVLAIDWDVDISEETCLQNVINNAKSGSIVVFHDSVKAARNMQYALPKVLDHFSKQGYKFKRIPE